MQESYIRAGHLQRYLNSNGKGLSRAYPHDVQFVTSSLLNMYWSDMFIMHLVCLHLLSEFLLNHHNEGLVGDVVCGFLDLDHALLQHVPPVPCLLPHHFLKTNY